MRRRLRALDWLLVLALMGSWVVVAARTLDEGLRTGQARIRVSLRSAAAPERFPTVRANPVDTWNAGLAEDDEILSVAGADLRGRTALDFFEKANQAALAEGSALLQVRRAGSTFEVRIPWLASPGWWLQLASSAAALLSSLVLFVAVPGWQIARRYFVSVWCFAATAVLIPGVVPPRTVFEGFFICAVLPLGAFLMVLAAQEFTSSARPVPWLHRGLAAASCLAVFALFSGMSFVPLPRPLESLALVFAFPFFIGAAIAGLVRTYQRSEPLERRQIRWLVLGGFVAATAQLLNVIVFLGKAPYALAAPLTMVIELALPAGVLVSVVGYGWLDVDRLISATASYALLALGVLGAALALIPRFAGSVAPLVGIDASTGQWALTLALVGAAIPAHQFLRPRIDRRLFAERHERMLGFERLAADLGRATSVEGLTRLCGERLDSILAPESIAIYARQETAFMPLFVRGRGAPPAFAADSPLLHTLERRTRPLAADASELDAFDRAALETLGTALVVPIRRGEAIVALTCLGPKRSGDIYTPEEVAHLTAIAHRCAEMLGKLGDEVVIAEAREMQQALRRYVPSAIAQKVVSGDELAPGEREVTVLFVDIRGYTGLAEGLRPEDVFATLNEHTERVSRVVQKNGGTVVEFNGDGMMVVFGAPEPLPRKELQSVEAAREIVDSMPASLSVGVGVATGPAFVGSIRAADRLIWTAVGSTTNLASRLQSLTGELGAAIAIDATTRERAGYVCEGFVRHADLTIRGRTGALRGLLAAATTLTPAAGWLAFPAAGSPRGLDVRPVLGRRAKTQLELPLPRGQTEGDVRGLAVAVAPFEGEHRGAEVHQSQHEPPSVRHGEPADRASVLRASHTLFRDGRSGAHSRGTL